MKNTQTHIDSPASIGLRITLDTNEIYPDDPGQGTPVMVETLPNGKGFQKTYAGTWDCVMDNGELDCGSYILNDSQKAWLAKQESAVDAWRQANGV